MLLVIHICVALATVTSSIALLINAKKSLQATTMLGTTGTIASGATLAVLQNASLLYVCLSGMLLTSFACVSMYISRSRLATSINQ